MDTYSFVILLLCAGVTGLAIMWRVAHDHTKLMSQITERWEKK